jgi:hypothetical protein
VADRNGGKKRLTPAAQKQRKPALRRYTTANRNVKTSIKADKRNYVEALAEEAVQHGNMKDLSNTTKKLSGKFSKSEVESFAYVGSIVDKQRGTGADVKIRISKARTAFLHLKGMDIQIPVNQHQDQTVQHQCKVGTTVRGRDLEDHSEHH